MAPLLPIDQVESLLAEVTRDVDAGMPEDAVAERATRLVELVRRLDLRDADVLTIRYLYAGAIEVSLSLRDTSGDASLRLGLETLREALERLRESDAVAAGRPLGEVVDGLIKALRVSQPQLATWLDVSPSTIGRWLNEADAGPDTEGARRARDLARVVRQLRRVLTARGTIEWLEAPHADLKSRRPLELLGDPRFDTLLQLASQGRSQSAS